MDLCKMFSMLEYFVRLCAVFVGMVQFANCLSIEPVDNPLPGFVNATSIPGISTTDGAMESHSNFSTTPAERIHLNITSVGNASTETATTDTTIKTTLVTIPAKLPPRLTTHAHEHRPSPTIFTNSVTPAIKLPETTMSTTTIAETKEFVIGSRWDAWNQLLTINYWKERVNDQYYLRELLIPMAAGIALCLVLATIFCFVRCVICLRYRRKKKSKMNYHSSEKLSDNTWMLLGNSDSEEDAV